MRLLVTGGCGFIGSNFIRYILSKCDGVEVLNVDSLSYGSNVNNLKDIESDRRYRFIKGSIADLGLIGSLVKDVDVVVNFAAETHVDRSIAAPWPFFESNTRGTMVILEAIRTSGKDVKLLHVSTDEVYGDILAGSFKEVDSLRPSSPYAATKAAADMLCLAYRRTYALDIIISRCTNNFGPYQFPEKLIPKTIIRARLGLKVPVYGSGENVRDWIYVLDHCDAIDFLIKNGRAGEIYNISGGNELTNIEVVGSVLGIMGYGDEMIEFVEDRPGHDVRYSLDSSKIRELGWGPRHSFKSALKETVDWYLRNEWWWRPLLNEKTLHPTPWKLRW